MMFEILFSLEFFSTRDTFKTLTKEVKFHFLQSNTLKTTYILYRSKMTDNLSADSFLNRNGMITDCTIT